MDLDNCGLNNIDYLSSKKIQELRLQDNNITSLEPLAGSELLSYLNIENNNINSLKGLENTTTLKKLFADNNNIPSLDPIKNCTEMLELYADHNRIRTVEPLQNLTKLIYIRMDNNDIIGGLSYLENLTQVQSLSLEDNKIEVVATGIAKMTNLTYLYLMNNKIRDISGISNLTKLRAIYLDNNEINDISPLRTLTGQVEYLSEVKIDYNYLDLSDSETRNLINQIDKKVLIFNRAQQYFKYLVFDHPGFETAVRDSLNKPSGDISSYDVLMLKHLSVKDIPCENDLDKISNAWRLEYLEVNNCGLTDPEKITVFENISHLEIARNKFSDDFNWLRALDLTHLVVYGNKIKDLEFLHTLRNLTCLDISYSDFDDFSILDKTDVIYNLSQLVKLDVSGTGFDNTALLRHFTALEELYINETDIDYLEYINLLINLRILHFMDNDIGDISPLSSLANLTEVKFQFNQVNNIKPLENLQHLEKVVMGYNYINVNGTISSGIIATLEARGAEVDYLPQLLKAIVIPDTVLNSKVRAALGVNSTTMLTSYKMLELEELDISVSVASLDSEKVHDLEGLEYAKNMQILRMNNNALEDIYELLSLEDMIVLEASNNQISDLYPLVLMDDLEVLRLAQNEISDISFLQYSPKLETINLANNKIRYLKGIEDLENVSYLDLSHNKIKDIGALFSYENIDKLDVSYNYIYLTLFPKNEAYQFLFDMEIMGKAIDYECQEPNFIGDINRNLKIDGKDISEFQSHYGAEVGQYDITDDLDNNNDGSIDILDIIRAIKGWH